MTAEVSVHLAHKLAHNNLIRVFSERDLERRRIAIAESYTTDVEFYEPDGVYVGHDGILKKVDELLSDKPEWQFVPVGKVKRNHGMLYLAWVFGPKDRDGQIDVKASGGDVLQIEGDKIKKFWVYIDGVTDVDI